MEFITLNPDNVMSEHLCCAISDKKHQTGVNDKRNWLSERVKEGHVFRKLDAQGKVFIEYAPLEKAWVPVTGDNYLYRALTMPRHKGNRVSVCCLPKRRSLSCPTRNLC